MAVAGLEFEGYFQAIADNFGRSSNLYTLTDTQDKKHFYDMGLMVQTPQPKKPDAMPFAEKQNVETRNFASLPVLEAIRKYANDHVLLVGKPGSGKSTALQQLVLEEANRPLPPTPLSCKERGEDSPPSLVGKGAGGLGQIPVLVELRYWVSSPSVLSLIRRFLKQYRLLRDESYIENLLFEGKLLLLIDGLNELPSNDARLKVQAFRQEYPQIPMIFTTRDLDLGVGGDLGIKKQLEMQPLTEQQMRSFVTAYLPQQGDEMLRQLGDRLRELGQTPLILKMLCEVFDYAKQVPKSRGALFHWFDREFDKLKGVVPIAEGLGRWKSELLQHLAFVMMQGENPKEKPTDFRLSISRGKAEAVLEDFLKNRVDSPGEKAKDWLQDLLKHYLIQTGADREQIEFHHQLFQEYYAAEYLRKLLPSLSDAKLKRDYLNLLKWTEPLALMLALVEDEGQAVPVVQLALDVDLMLGARLAGEVKREFQEKTVGLVNEHKLENGQEVPHWLKVQLLGITRSECAIAFLIKAQNHQDHNIRVSVIDGLGKIGTNTAILQILKALEDENTDVYQKAAEWLGYLGYKEAIPKLRDKLADWGSYSDRDIIVWMSIVEALGKLSKQDTISVLRDRILKYIDKPFAVCCFNLFGAGKVLQSIDDNVLIPELFEALTDINSDYSRVNAAHILGEIGNKSAVSKLHQALEKENNSDVREHFLNALVELDEEAAIPILLKDLQDENNHVCRKAAEILIEVNNPLAISGLCKLLIHTDEDIRWCATIILGKLGRKEALSGLVNGLTYPNSNVREMAAILLGELGSQETLLALCQALKDKYYYVRRSAAMALAQLDCEEAIPELIKALRHYRMNVESSVKLDTHNLIVQGITEEELENLGDEEAIERWLFELSLNFSIFVKVAEALGKLDNEEAINRLIEALEDSHWAAAIALGKLGRKEAIPKLINYFINSHPELRKNIVEALVKVSNEEVIQEFINALDYNDYEVRTRAAEGLIKIGSPTAVYRLWQMRLKGREDVTYIIESIQASCKFYDYDIFNSPLLEENQTESQSSNSPNTSYYNIQGNVGILNAGDVTNQGNQIGEQYKK